MIRTEKIEKIEKEVKKRGVDPEKLEEIIHPGLHAEALSSASKKYGFDGEQEEEKVSPGIHARMGRLLKPSYKMARAARKK